MNDREIILGMIEEYFEEQMECRMAVTANAITDLLTSHGVTVQKHGRWKGAGMGDYYCSLCCEEVSGNRHQFCPNCGAKMDGKADE